MMANLKRDTTGYSLFGRILDELCQTKQISFRALAQASHLQPGYHTVLAKICRGEVTPKREHILLWADILEATNEQRHDLLHAFHYDSAEEGQNQPLEIQEQLRARAKFDSIAGELANHHDFHLLVSELGEAWNDQFHPDPASAVELLERLFVALTSGKEWTPTQRAEMLQRLGDHREHYREHGQKWAWEA